MKAFHSGREAKEYLISRIVAEAQSENVPLSEVERKMLYFSESGWTLPDMMAVSEDFDRDYDQHEYEKKIAGFISKADKHVRKESREEYDAWWSAIRFLKGEDHYILVMFGIAGLRPAGDQLKLLVRDLASRPASCSRVSYLLNTKSTIHDTYRLAAFSPSIF
jgi:hypothetical protein